MKKVKKEKITIDKLAVIIKSGFEDVATKFEKVATKEEVGEKIDELARLTKAGFDLTATKEEMQTGFDVVNKRLDKIENLLIRDHSNKIERLEDNMRIVKTKLGIY